MRATHNQEVAQEVEASQSPDGHVPERFVRFDRHPRYQYIEAIRNSETLEQTGNPFFRRHEGSASAHTIIDGHDCWNFASYNYLGLCGHPHVNQAAHEAIERYGTSVSASRMVAGERPIHQQLETTLADRYQTADALVFVSGYATNVATIDALLGRRDLILHDEHIHNSTLAGARLSGARRLAFDHNDPESLEALLEYYRPSFERVLVVIEGLYSMDGDIPDLEQFVAIKRRHQAWLMVDEAHSFGVLGENGRGLREHAGVPSDTVDIWMGTLSKAFASSGGFIAGSQPLIDILRHLAPGFLYSVGIAPQVAAPALAALELLDQEPDRAAQLRHIAHYFLEQARQRGLNTGHADGYAVVPIITGSSHIALHASQVLFTHGINVQPILYPAVPEDGARLRFFLSRDHTVTQVDETLDILQQILSETV